MKRVRESVKSLHACFQNARMRLPQPVLLAMYLVCLSLETGWGWNSIREYGSAYIYMVRWVLRIKLNTSCKENLSMVSETQ